MSERTYFILLQLVHLLVPTRLIISEADKQLIVNEHNRVRRNAVPTGSNMEMMVCLLARHIVTCPME